MTRADSGPNLDALADAIEAALPQLDCVGPLKLIDVGFGSIVVETRDEVIFRIARHERCAAGHQREWRLLPALGPRVPLRIPLPEWRIAPGSAHFPFGAIGYRRLPGRPVSLEFLEGPSAHPIARRLGSFLYALHAFPTTEAVALGIVPVEDMRAGWNDVRSDVSPALPRLFSSREVAMIERWWDDLMHDKEMLRYEPVVVHSDLWYGNVLFDDEAGRITGVVDFESTHIGDPAEDLATQLHAGPGFARRVISEYCTCGGRWDERVEHRVRRYWELREFYGLQFGIVHDSPEEIEDGVRKLRAGPIIRPQDHPYNLS